MIDVIQNPLLKSAELTGQWEKQLREIEDGKFSAKVFIDNMKTMVDRLVDEVRMAKSVKIVSTKNNDGHFAKKKKKPNNIKKVEGQTCPKCKKGILLKGNSAFGCSRFKEGCQFRLPFKFKHKKIPEKQLIRLLEYGATIQLSGFSEAGKKLKGNLKFDKDFQLFLKENENKTKESNSKSNSSDSILCPKCNVGKVIKGNSAYGCSNWQTGCDWRFSFQKIREIAQGKKLSKSMVTKILNNHSV